MIQGPSVFPFYVPVGTLLVGVQDFVGTPLVGVLLVRGLGSHKGCPYKMR
jgi:hypothetical protein